MSKRQPKWADAAAALRSWSLILRASEAPELRELGRMLDRVADRESLRVVFGQRPRARRLTDAIIQFKDLRLQGISKSAAAKKTKLSPETVRRHGKKIIVGRAKSSQSQS